MITTASPLDDPKVKLATMKAVKSEFGEDVADELFTGGNRQDGEEKLDDDIIDYRTELGFDKYTKCLLDTEHLKDFDKFDKYLGLDGEAYAAYKKCLWYLAQSLKQSTSVYDVNYKTKIDNRINILAIAPPASGKTTSKNKMKRFVSKEEVTETSGLSHPQQLIGKTIPATTKKPRKEIPGILSYKFVIHDEVQDLLNEKNPLYSASQKLKRQAMDVYGDNQIDKKLVSNEPGEETICISPSRFLDFAHPKKLESPFFDTGSFRRYFIFNLVADESVDIKALTEFKLDGDSNYNNFPIILMQDYRNTKRHVEFDQLTLDIISHCHATILNFLLNCKNENAFRYGLLMRYNFRSVISKVVYILALAKDEKIPSVDTTIMACRDAMLFIFESIKAVNELADISTTSDVWHGLDENNAMALTWLLRKKYTSFETSKVSIRKFWTVLANIHGCKITQARAHYYRLKKDGFVDSKKGKDDSKMWLRFIPREFKLINSANNLEFLDSVSQDCQSKKPILTVLREIYTDDNEFEKAKSDGSASVMAYIIYNTRRSFDILYYINIYNKGTPTLTEPTLLDIGEPATDDKQIEQDYQKAKNGPTLLAENVPTEPESTRDIQYFEAPECKTIQVCSKETVLDYTNNNPNYTINELLEKFGPSILALKKEGVIK